LYLRVFHAYDAGFHGYIDQQTVQNDPVHGKEERALVQLDTTSWCAPPSTFRGQTIVVDVLVADRPYDDTDTSSQQFRHVRAPGKSNMRSWVVQCPVP